MMPGLSHDAILWWKVLASEMGYPAQRGDAEPHKSQADYRADSIVALFHELARTNDSEVLLEIGAFAAHTSKNFIHERNFRQAYAFEASPLNYKEFAEANSVDRLHYMNMAVGANKGSVKFNVPTDPAFKIWGSVAERSNFDAVEACTVEMTTVDDFLAENPLARTGRRSIAWIDVEGLAQDVLMGAQKALHSDLAVVYIEVEDGHYFKDKGVSKGSSIEVIGKLLENDFVPIARDNEWNGAWNLLAVHRQCYDSMRSVIANWTYEQAKRIHGGAV